MNRILGYCRVSSREQADNLNALEQQVQRVKAAGADEILIDVESGRGSKTSKREKYQQLLQLVEAGEVDRVIITRLDRLGRSLPELRNALGICERNGAAIVALDQQIDMGTAVGKFQANLLGALAEMYSDELSEKINHGKRHFRRQQRASHPPFGYTVRKFKFYPDRSPWLCTLDDRQEWSKADAAVWHFEQYLYLKSLDKGVAAFTEKFGYQRCWANSYRRWLLSPVLRGHVVYFPKSPKPEIHRDTHEAIVTEEQYSTIVEALAFNKSVGGFGSSGRAKYPLSGLLRCPACNSRLIISNGSKGRIQYYTCPRARLGNCDRSEWLRLDTIADKVIDGLVEKAGAIADESSQVVGGPPPKSPELIKLESQLADLERLDYNPILEEAKAKLRDAIAAAQTNEITETEDKATAELKRSLLRSLPDRAYWASLDDPSRREIYRGLIDAIVVQSADRLEIKWRF